MQQSRTFGTLSCDREQAGQGSQRAHRDVSQRRLLLLHREGRLVQRRLNPGNVPGRLRDDAHVPAGPVEPVAPGRRVDCELARGLEGRGVHDEGVLQQPRGVRPVLRLPLEAQKEEVPPAGRRGGVRWSQRRLLLRRYDCAEAVCVTAQ